MRGSMVPRMLALALACLLSLVVATPVLRADDAPPADAKPAAEAPATPEVPAAEAPVGHQPEPEMVEAVKLIKLDPEAKTVTVLIPPDPAKSGRAYKKLKLALDENSLIMVDQQPSTLAALQQGMIVNVSHLKKGKVDTVDTIVVVKAAEPE